MDFLLSPPVAFLLYVPLVTIILLIGKKMAGSDKSNPMKSSIYGGGESAPTNPAAPGYRPFFLVAFFFAFLHLGMLVLGTGGLTIITGIYTLGLMLGLVALILG
jgi:hypothetical protein